MDVRGWGGGDEQPEIKKITYLPIIPVLLDKVTCLTSALFLLLSFFISFLFFFLEQVGGGVGWGR